jgi:kynurenine 3-monooxygenase
MDNRKNKITIIGTGLAGSFLAVILARKGFTVEIYERLEKKDICDLASKRSYNIVLFGYGINILKQADLWKDIQPYLLSLKGSVTHITKETKPVVTVVDQEKTPYFTITRARLADILLKQATKHPSVTIHYNMSLVSIDRHYKTIVVQNNKTKKVSTVTCEVIIGADGTNSLVRSFIQIGQHTNHSQEFASWIYKQFILSPVMVEKLRLEKGFVHVWTQKKAFIIMHPDKKDAQYALLVFPKNTDNSIALNSANEIEKFFTQNFPELLPGLDEITTSLLGNPNGNFSTIHTDPWYYKDFITLVGDAAHGFYPFFGQGTSAAFGDCMALIELIDRYGSDWSKIFPIYQEKRKKHMDTLGELSKDVLSKYLRYKKADFDAIYDKLELMAYHLFPKVIHKPLSQAINTDPAHAADYQQIHLRQRTIAKRLGISFIVAFMSIIIGEYEKITK